MPWYSNLVELFHDSHVHLLILVPDGWISLWVNSLSLGVFVHVRIVFSWGRSWKKSPTQVEATARKVPIGPKWVSHHWRIIIEYYVHDIESKRLRRGVDWLDKAGLLCHKVSSCFISVPSRGATELYVLVCLVLLAPLTNNQSFSVSKKNSMSPADRLLTQEALALQGTCLLLFEVLRRF